MNRILSSFLARTFDVSFWLYILHSSTLVFPQLEYAFNNQITDKSASCDRNFIYFTITFSRPFLGLIYTDGSFGLERCTYVNGSVFSQSRYNITIPLNECRSQTFPNGSSQNVIVVQRDWRILEASDNLFVITCTSSSGQPGSGPGGLDSAGNGKFTLSFAGVTVQGSPGSTEVVTSSFSDVDYTAEVIFGTGPIGRKLDRALGVGEPISYVVKLRKIRPGQIDARIGRCWANDGLASPSNTEIQLSDDDGCTVLPGSNIWNNFRSAPSNEPGEDEKILYNDIKAWAFPTSNRVNIFCNLHLCPSTCPPTSCRQRDETGTTPSLSIFTTATPRNGSGKIKTKRKTKEEGIVIETAYEVIADRRVQDEPSIQHDSLLIRAPLTDSHHVVERKESSQKTVCLTRTNFIVGISLLLLIIILSSVFIIALLCKLSKARRPKWRFYNARVQEILSNRQNRLSLRRSETNAETPDIDSESAITGSTATRAFR